MAGGVTPFDPAPGAVDRGDLDALIALWHEHGEQAPATVDGALAERLATVARAPAAALAPFVEALDDDSIEALIRMLVLAEAADERWRAGEASAVVPLFAAWRSRGNETRDLVRWIRAHSDNRFLPHGSLQGRLKV